MEAKFNKCLQNFRYLFYFGIVIDPRTKLDGMEYLIIEFHKNMGYESNIQEPIADTKACLDYVFYI